MGLDAKPTLGSLGLVRESQQGQERSRMAGDDIARTGPCQHDAMDRRQFRCRRGGATNERLGGAEIMTSEAALWDLRADALAIRRFFLQMHFQARAGHLGTGLSDIDILTYLYRGWLREGDKFILSKGHAASSLYATLHHYGVLSDEELETYYKDGTLLPAHPAPAALP